VNVTPKTYAVETTVCSLAGLEFENCEHVALLLLGVRALKVAAFTQWTNVLRVFVLACGGPSARVGYIVGHRRSRVACI
jgi:hypothetical protein